MHSLAKIVNNSYYFLNKYVPILQNQKNNKFLHNLKYSKNNELSKNTFEGYLNCGACCYLLSYYLETHNIKTKMKKTLLIISTFSAMFAAQAMAADFKDYDLDQDGFISKSEAALSESLASIFDKLDSDGDGKLSEQEFNQ